MWLKTRHKIVFWLLRGPFKLFFKIKYNFKSVNYKLENKPYLILSNHFTILDPFMVAASFKRPIYFIASSDLYANKYGRIIKYLVNPVFKNKNVKEIGPIKECIRIFKEGGTVGVFPEGNRTYDGKLCYIDEAIAKMAKMMKTDIVLYNIVGGYGIDPRWCYKGRRGKSYGYVKRIITVEEAQKMSVTELFEVIKCELTVLQVPTTIKYKGKALAEGLERILYKCPICGHTQTIYTNRDYVYCSHCSLKVKYNENLEFTTDEKRFEFKFVEDWYKYQLDYVKSFNIATEGVIYQDNLTLKLVTGKEKINLLKGKLKFTTDEMIFSNSEKSLEFTLDEISSMTVLGKNKLNFYVDDKIYQLKGDKSLNTLKYMHMYYHIKNIRGGHKDEYLGM